MVGRHKKNLNVVNATNAEVVFLFGRIDVIELNVILDAFFANGDGLVDPYGLGEFTVGFKVTGLISRIF